MAPALRFSTSRKAISATAGMNSPADSSHPKMFVKLGKAKGRKRVNMGLAM